MADDLWDWAAVLALKEMALQHSLTIEALLATMEKRPKFWEMCWAAEHDATARGILIGYRHYNETMARG